MNRSRTNNNTTTSRPSRDSLGRFIRSAVTTTPARTNRVVTDPTEAVNILRAALTDIGRQIPETGTRRKWVSVREIVQWHDRSSSQNLQPGWFGRTLNSVSNVKVFTVGGVNYYNLSR